MTIRSFLAFDIPEEVKKNLANVVRDFQSKERGVKWSNVDNMHVTMKFFGSVEEELLLGEISSRIESVVEACPSTNLTCQGLGVFPNWKYPRVFWAGFAGDTNRVVDLQRHIGVALEGLELPEEKSDFRLHLTLGRVKARLHNTELSELVEKLGPILFGQVPVKSLILYKSVLTKEGPIYTKLKEFYLSGSAA